MGRSAISVSVPHSGLWGVLRHLYRRHQAIFLDYPVRATQRYGYGRSSHPELHAFLDLGRNRYADFLRRCLDFAEPLGRIPARGNAASPDPAWLNDFLSGPDSAALYAFLATGNPQRYVEVGSGNSTRFARRAIGDHGLRTQIVSIDPRPRVDIDSLADTVIRQPLEDIDLSVITSLGAGDVLFVDGSHRCFMNSDVAVTFLEILPRLSSGVRVHIHDIFLPYDYPPGWEERYYSEQYLLAAYLLGGARRLRVLLPNAFVTADTELSGILAPIWARPGLEAVERVGCSFWAEIV